MKTLVKKMFRLIKRKNLLTYFIELLIVIIGITIAFQFEKYETRRKENQNHVNLLKGLRNELKLNIKELESLNDYREDIRRNTKFLYELLYNIPDVKIDSVEMFLSKIIRISTPDLQLGQLNIYLNNSLKQSSKNKPILLNLKNVVDELEVMNNYHWDRKHLLYSDYINDSFDFGKAKIIHPEKFKSLAFKNNMRNMLFNELELNKLHKAAIKQFKEALLLIESQIEE